MTNLTIKIVATVALIAGGALVANSGIFPPSANEVRAAVTNPATQANLKSVELQVDGMYCGSCGFIVRTNLTDVDGVIDAAVSMRRGIATVAYDQGKTSPDVLAAAVTRNGYPARVMVQ
jgi:copper chaperone CopZ